MALVDASHRFTRAWRGNPFPVDHALFDKCESRPMTMWRCVYCLRYEMDILFIDGEHTRCPYADLGLELQEIRWL
jgi:hypothetical protein